MSKAVPGQAFNLLLGSKFDWICRGLKHSCGHQTIGGAAVMNTRQRIEAKAKSNLEQALTAFMAQKAEIDTMLARLTALSADHFDTSPEEINWGHVGILGRYACLLKQITDMAFREGEYAK